MEREDSKRPLTTSDMSRLYLVAVLEQQGAHEDAVALAEDAAEGLARDVACALTRPSAPVSNPLVREIFEQVLASAEASTPVSVVA